MLRMIDNLLPPARRQLNKGQTLRLLDEIESSPGPGASIYIVPGRPMEEVRGMIEATLKPGPALDSLIDHAVQSSTGAAIFWGEGHQKLLLPPFPLREARLAPGYAVEPLREFLRRERALALVLLRLGNYAIGVFRGEHLVSSKVGTGLVHGRHRNGGSSAHRFERHRDKQMEGFFTRVCAHARERIEPHISEIEHIVYGGERFTLLAFRKQCRFVQQLDDRALGRLLNIHEPKQASLPVALAEAWSSIVLEWKEEHGPLLPRQLLAGE